MNPTEETNTPQQESGVAIMAKSVSKFTDEHAKEIRLPSVGAVNYMFATSKMLSSSALVTKDMGLTKDQLTRFRELGMQPAEILAREENAVVANMVAKMLIGFEMQVDPIESLQCIDIVKNRTFVRYPQLIRQMEEIKGYVIEEIERSDTRAAIKVTKPNSTSQEFSFSIEDAQRAGLCKRGGYNGDSPSQYELRPRVMLWARVVSEAYRATGGKSGAYAMEEKQEILGGEYGNDPGNAVAVVTENPYYVGERETNTQAAPEKGAAARATADAKATEAPAAPQAQTIPVVVDQKMPADQIKMVNTATASTVTATNVAPPAKTETQAEPSKSGPKTLKTELDSISELIPQLSPETLKKKHFIEFLRGFFNISKIGKADESRMLAVIPVLRAICKDYSGQFQQDPHGSGVMAGAGYRGLTKYLGELNFPEDFNNLAHSIALGRYADSGGGDLIEFLQDVAKVNEMGIPDARAFLQVFAIARGEAMRLKVIAALSGKGIQEIVVGWNQDLMKMTEASVKALLDDAERIAKANPAPDKVTPIDTQKSAAPAAKVADDEEELSLFDLGGE